VGREQQHGGQPQSQTDELKVDVPVTRHPQIVEQFTIELIKSDGMAEMILMWDDVRVTIPVEYQ
jgi:hypothetical protein